MRENTEGIIYHRDTESTELKTEITDRMLDLQAKSHD